MQVRAEYLGLSVGDLDRQREFYAGAFQISELEAALDLPEAGIRSVIICSSNGLRLELIERRGSTRQDEVDVIGKAFNQGYTHLALRVDDLTGALRAVEAAGGAVVSGPAMAQRPGVRFAYVRDPEGNLIELVAAA
jgi:catechol 2,3-dioxygenase-like lactoylglutathione lyase family enzyme